MAENSDNKNLNKNADNPSDEIKRIKTIQRERKILKGRLRQERSRGFVRFLITISILMFMFLFSKLHGLYFSENSFKYVGGTSIEIINNRIVPSYKILAILQSVEAPKGCVFFAKTDNIKKKLMALTPIDKIYIRRYAFPARIQIIVRESMPTIVVMNDLKTRPVAYFTTKGKIIGKEYLPLNKNIKTLTVLAKGTSYGAWNKAQQQKLLKVAKFVETYAKEPIEYIDYRNPNDVYVKVKGLNIRLGILDDTVWSRIERLPSILPQLKLVHSKIKYLDLSWDKVNYLKLD